MGGGYFATTTKGFTFAQRFFHRDLDFKVRHGG